MCCCVLYPVISDLCRAHLHLQAPTRQVMHYWLQQLQQKRWEYSNTRGAHQRDSWCSPTLAYPPTGLVGNGMQIRTHARTHSHVQHCVVCTVMFTDPHASCEQPPLCGGLIITLDELICWQVCNCLKSESLARPAMFF